MEAGLLQEFRKRFQKEAEHVFFSPGRVNLIGEHIDYNGGKVMPCAITQGTWLAISRNTDKRLRFQCLNFPELAALQLQTSYTRSGGAWYNYPLGIISRLLVDGHNLSGLDMLFCSNLPIGAGLSSSASIEVLTAFALNELFNMDISRIEMAILCKKVENEFIGVNCGIMDQFAVALGQKNKAILLDCDKLDYEYLPFDIGDHVLVIINTNKERTLIASKYNERFTECGFALKRLKQELKIDNLCNLDIPSFESHRHLINDPVLEKRALHVIGENIRVGEAAEALKAGDLVRFGELMYASHQSLLELYEVSGRELDTIVDFCKTYSGCIGARMTGAGFGGCAIALAVRKQFEDFAEKLTDLYKTKIGYKPQIFTSEIGDGVREIKR